MTVQVFHWNDKLAADIATWDDSKKMQTIFLEQHPDYPTYLLVNAVDPMLPHKLAELVGEYSAVHMLKLDEFYKTVDEVGYDRIVYLTEAEQILSWLDGLEEEYPFKLGEYTLKHFQLQGFNLTKDLESAIINWSTGTGKSVYAVARAKYLLETGKIDKVVVASKNHNKINWQRQFMNVGGLEAIVAEAGGKNPTVKRERRHQIYKDSQIFIVNYEKFRWRDNPSEGRTLAGKKRPDPSGDGQEIFDALKKQRVLWIWDEMPSKLKSMGTNHFNGIKKIQKKTKQDYQVMLTATKIETDPENIYNCMKILDPKIWSSKTKFRSLYAKRMSTFADWQVASWDPVKLRELGMRISHMTHVANKYSDPAIRDEFPEDHWDDIIIDMSPQDRKLYDAARTDVIADLAGEFSTVLSKMNILQQICNNPAIVNQSDSKLAQALVQRYNFTDKYCAKLEKLQEMLDQIDGKVVLFSMYNDFGMKMLIPYLVKWGHNFVIYDGNIHKKQLAEDRFRADPNIKIFLSSDMGSDSINLEKASSVINYDLPWNHSTLIQRVNRISRLTSEAEHVYYYNLITALSVEEKKLKILNIKKLMEEAVDTDLKDQSEIMAGLTLDDLKWMLEV